MVKLEKGWGWGWSGEGSGSAATKDSTLITLSSSSSSSSPPPSFFLSFFLFVANYLVSGTVVRQQDKAHSWYTSRQNCDLTVGKCLVSDENSACWIPSRRNALTHCPMAMSKPVVRPRLTVDWEGLYSLLRRTSASLLLHTAAPCLIIAPVIMTMLLLPRP